MRDLSLSAQGLHTKLRCVRSWYCMCCESLIVQRKAAMARDYHDTLFWCGSYINMATFHLNHNAVCCLSHWPDMILPPQHQVLFASIFISNHVKSAWYKKQGWKEKSVMLGLCGLLCVSRALRKEKRKMCASAMSANDGYSEWMRHKMTQQGK